MHLAAFGCQTYDHQDKICLYSDWALLKGIQHILRPAYWLCFLENRKGFFKANSTTIWRYPL